MTGNTQELDGIFDKMGYPKNTDFRKEAIRLITDWHNKQTTKELDAIMEWHEKEIEVVLDRLQPKDWASDDTPLSMTRNDFYMTIEAERNKLEAEL